MASKLIWGEKWACFFLEDTADHWVWVAKSVFESARVCPSHEALCMHITHLWTELTDSSWAACADAEKPLVSTLFLPHPAGEGLPILWHNKKVRETLSEMWLSPSETRVDRSNGRLWTIVRWWGLMECSDLQEGAALRDHTSLYTRTDYPRVRESREAAGSWRQATATTQRGN